MSAIAVTLRQAGYRVTPQRHMILDAICELGGHVTPEMVYEFVHERMPALNQATVYRTLQFLSEQRILTVTQMLDGRFGYELAAEEPHHHLVCRHCQASVEIPQGQLTSLFEQIEAAFNFRIEMDHISFFGLCEHCQNEN
jgi:Fur family ferric uptake transcriptional regulator